MGNNTVLERVRCREQIPFLLNHLGLLGIAVEVGVEWGHFSHHILRHWFGRLLYSVDPWIEQPSHQYNDLCNASAQVHEARFSYARALLQVHGPRSNVLRTFSGHASRCFSDATLDFVYLDGNHSFESVLSDLTNWYPKVRPGGLLCGHDYIDGLGDAVYGVKSAVDFFFSGLRERVHLTQEPIAKSWLVQV
jgi:hypothetical protein